VRIAQIASQILKNADEEEILVKGYGRITKKQLKSEIKSYIEGATKFLNKEDYKNVNHILYSSGVLKSLLESAIKLD